MADSLYLRLGRRHSLQLYMELKKYLGSGLIKGVGPKFAKRIVGLFGTETLDVIECEISRLKEVEGIGEKRIRQIKESWQKQKEIKNVMLFCRIMESALHMQQRSIDSMANESIEKVKENPFRLADDIWGIGFRTADGIAQKLGFEKKPLYDYGVESYIH